MSKSSRVSDYLGWFTERKAEKPGTFSGNFFHGHEPTLCIVRCFSDSMVHNDQFTFNHEAVRYGSRYSRMEQVKFVKDNL